MTKAEYIKCLNDLKAIRERIKGNFETVGELSKDNMASDAYRLSIQLEVALDKMLAPDEG